MKNHRDMVKEKLSALEAAQKQFFAALSDVVQSIADGGACGEEELLTCDEAGKILGQTASHVRVLYHAGRLKGRRVSERGIRIYRSSLAPREEVAS